MEIVTSDSPRAARESDFRRLSKQVPALNHLLGDVQRRVFALEAIAADFRADLIAGKEVDEAITEVLDGLLEDISGR